MVTGVVTIHAPAFAQIVPREQRIFSIPRCGAMTNRRPGRDAGYTLLEVVVVLTLTGLIAAIAYPRIDVTRYKADAVVTTVRSVIQQAQRASLVGQHDVIVSFDLPGNGIRLVWDANNNHQIEPTERVMVRLLTGGNRFQTPAVGVRGAVTEPVVGTGVKKMDDMPTVTFHRDGSLSSELEIYMASAAAPLKWRAVTVVQATGRTDWFRSNPAGNWVAGAL